MVAKRLTHLVGKTDLSNIRQILDIGSWHLEQSIEFAKVFTDAVIDAFEPVPESYELCKERWTALDKQKKNRINIHNTAISDSTGEISFYPVNPIASSVPNVGASSMFKFIDGLNGIHFGQNLVQQEIIVGTTTLDEWCTRNKVMEVDIMWVDVQGAELLVFKGADHILKNTKIIMTEAGLKPYYDGHTLKGDIDSFLQERGFRELEGSYEEHVPDYEANVIYIRDSISA